MFMGARALLGLASTTTLFFSFRSPTIHGSWSPGCEDGVGLAVARVPLTVRELSSFHLEMLCPWRASSMKSSNRRTLALDWRLPTCMNTMFRMTPITTPATRLCGWCVQGEDPSVKSR